MGEKVFHQAARAFEFPYAGFIQCRYGLFKIFEAVCFERLDMPQYFLRAKVFFFDFFQSFLKFLHGFLELEDSALSYVICVRLALKVLNRGSGDMHARLEQDGAP